MPRFLRHAFRWAGILLGIAIGATFAQVLALRWFEPQSTAWMRMREREAHERQETYAVRHAWTPLARIPRDLRRAVIEAEDGKFYRHHGFDAEAIKAARARNERADDIRRGGSTITQQLAKNLFLSSERSYVRKGREAAIAAVMELLLPKDRILELYLNSIEFGPGVFGAAAAAEHHFGVPLAKLSRDQCCRLAAIIPAPLRYRVNGDYVGRRAAQLAKMIE